MLIGRRALVALGLPVLTQDYDFWIHGDDIDVFNEAVSGLDLVPSRPMADARSRGRYVLENDEKVDVLVARSVSTIDGILVAFDDVWTRRRSVDVVPGVDVSIPCLDDLILTKKFSARPKDAEDARLLETLRGNKP